MRDSHWQDRAACIGMDVNIFYAEEGSRKSDYTRSKNVHRKAKRVCARCPVRMECLVDALAWECGRIEGGEWKRNLPHGVRGGVTAQERHERCGKAQGRHSCVQPIRSHAEALEGAFQRERQVLLSSREMKEART